MWASLNSFLSFRTFEETLFSVILPECLSPGAVLLIMALLIEKHLFLDDLENIAVETKLSFCV